MDVIVEWPMYLAFYDFALVGIALAILLGALIFLCWATADLRLKRERVRADRIRCREDGIPGPGWHPAPPPPSRR